MRIRAREDFLSLVKDATYYARIPPTNVVIVVNLFSQDPHHYAGSETEPLLVVLLKYAVIWSS